MNQISKRSLGVVMSLLLLACNNVKKCSSSSNERLLQEYQAPKETFALWFADQGAFGSSVVLRVCGSKNNKLIEEIILRGEDYLPKIDSVIGDNVYIHYNFPRKQNENNIEPLEFESVVLGDALIKKRHLKYNYIFTNIKATE